MYKNDNSRADEIVRALRDDSRLQLIDKGGYLRDGICPACGKKELYVRKSQPFRIACGRENKCGASWTAKELLPHLFENWEKRFPPTDQNPNATASAYLREGRGFDIVKCHTWYSQESYRLKSGEYVPTVRFYLDKGRTRWWERLIGKTKADGQKANNGGQRKHDGTLFKGDAWMPPGQTIEPGDQVFITEGIFHSIALSHAGKKVAASISCSNFPSNLIEQNKGKNVCWVLAMDGDKAGRQHMRNHRLKILEMREQVDICLLPDGKKDWDDLWQEDQLKDDFFDKCFYHGRLFTSGSVVEKAWHTFCRNPTQRRFTVDYNNALWEIEVDSKFAAELHEENIILTSPEGYERFNIACTVDQICTVFPKFVYLEKDELVGDQRYVFQVAYENKTSTETVGLDGTAVSSADAFHKALLNNTSGGMYSGSANAFKAMTKKWFRRKMMTVKSVPYVGFEKKSGAWIFHKHAFLNGQKIALNEFDYFDLGVHGVKPKMKTFEIETDGDFNPGWFPNYLQAFNAQGLAVLAFWMGSLFAQQIRAKQRTFPFLEFTGEAGAGKTTVLEFCWKLVGRGDSYEGLNIINTNKRAKRRLFEQISNLPMVLIESDQGGMVAGKATQFNYESLKDLYNGGPPGTIGVATRDNATKSQNFLGTLVFSQNESVQGGEPILSRIVHCHADRKHHTTSTREVARWFERQEVADVCGFLEVALKNEKKILDTIFLKFPAMETFFEQRGVKHQRIIKCHAQVAAMAHALQIIFPNFTDGMLQAFLDYLAERALDRVNRIAADHPTVDRFWDAFDYINGQMTGTGLNISKHEDEIAFNLNMFRAQCVASGQELMDLTELKKLLPSSKRYTFITKNKPVWNQTDQKTMRCWVFKAR
ncbi:toprim domain-containing protein [uncultured Desulfobacter sp.]|uniref:toprim domain-containing protein n=1 Tax=uncultured Desulfobacter sp. TaxID=240139 RepID=UPI0029F463BB|nr:toprim domain-containing protein [uncultured Desulfobacter sp.]